MRLRGLTCAAALTPLLLAACESTSPVVTPPAAFTFTSADDTSTDFYRWDGTFLGRTASSAERSWDGRYYRGHVGGAEHIFSRGGADLGVIPDNAPAGNMWAQDADFLCGSGVDSQGRPALYVTDVHGKMRVIPVEGAIGGLQACSITKNRAVVNSADGQTWNIRSLTDGHVETAIPLTSKAVGFTFSADIDWLTVPRVLPGGAIETVVYRLGDGTLSARLPDVAGIYFTPDSRYLLVNNFKLNTYSLLDWRTGQMPWTRAGYIRFVLESDPTTNMMLLGVAADQSNEASRRQEFWIVNPHGVFTQFRPRE